MSVKAELLGRMNIQRVRAATSRPSSCRLRLGHAIVKMTVLLALGFLTETALAENSILTMLGRYRSDHSIYMIDEVPINLCYPDVVYTNASIVTNDSLTARIKHDGGTCEMPFEFLPWRFRAKYGIRSPSITNSAVDRPLNAFLAQHRQSELTVQRSVVIEPSGKNADRPGWGLWSTATRDDHDWALIVSPGRYQLSACTRRDGKIVRSLLTSFGFGQETVMNGVFEKFLEWEAVARRNDAELFERVIIETWVPFRPAEHRTFKFVWRKAGVDIQMESEAVLDDSGDSYTWGASRFCKHDVICFAEMSQYLQDMKAELVQKIRKKDEEQVMFK